MNARRRPTPPMQFQKNGSKEEFDAVSFVCHRFRGFMNCRNAAAVLWGFQLMKSLGLVELVPTADRGVAAC